jgi:hypothetical protein
MEDRTPVSLRERILRGHSRLFGVGMALWLSACGGSMAPPRPGEAAVQFLPEGPQVADLTLDLASLRLARVVVLGDAPPPPMGPMPPPEVDLDLRSGGITMRFTDLLPGVYSRVQLDFHAVMLAGTWRGTPFVAHLEPQRGTRVSLRAVAGQELVAGQDIAFTVAVDVTSWFADQVLDQAMVQAGSITCDDRANPLVSMQLADRVARSFLMQ